MSQTSEIKRMEEKFNDLENCPKSSCLTGYNWARFYKLLEPRLKFVPGGNVEKMRFFECTKRPEKLVKTVK